MDPTGPTSTAGADVAQRVIDAGRVEPAERS
jgi:hypothetical protein